MKQNRTRNLSRRAFLQMSGIAAVGALAVACTPAVSVPTDATAGGETGTNTAAESVVLNYWVVAGDRRGAKSIRMASTDLSKRPGYQ